MRVIYFQSQIVTENDLLSCIAKVLFSLGRLWDIFGSLLDGLGLLCVDFGSFWVGLELLLAALGILWDDLGSLWVGNLGNNKTFAQCFKITKKVSFYNFEMKARFSDFMWFWNTVILYKFLNFCAKNGQNGLLKIRKFISFWRWMLEMF